MNFIAVLNKHGLTETEYDQELLRLHGCTTPEFARKVPLIDWICSAFLLSRTEHPHEWWQAHLEWVSLCTPGGNKTVSAECG